jgi:hypothetical protein
LMRFVSDNGSAGPKAASVLISASARSQWATALPFGLPSCSQIKKAASEWPVVPDGSITTSLHTFSLPRPAIILSFPRPA